MAKFLSLVVFFGFGSWAQGEVKPYMDQMLKEIFVLKPYIVSDVEYRDPKNFEKIDESLKNMVSLSEKISHEGKIKKSGFAISSNALNQQLKEAELIYRVGNKDYSLWMLRSTLSVCMSCHTQLPATSTKFEFFNKEHALTKPYDEAEFLFIVRNFDKAVPLYDEVIADYPGNGVPFENVEKAVARKVYYFVRVKRDLPGLIKSLEKNQKNKQLPELLKKKIAGFKKAAEKMKKEGYAEFNADQQAELKKYVETELKDELQGDFEFSPQKDIAYLKISSVLYKYLDQYPDTPLKPDILYWLSFCERRYEQKAFYSLPELYLKQCVLEHPASAIAPSCLKEYQDLVTMAYTGSSGTHLPKDVDRELKSMKELIQKMKK
ncbi:MAG: hypothetical protein OM95_09565 [Bdellovibrio sp. ArHS]|uniref:hypothetical protein n=1 Tax=Bdellovibrio sp. ArHS TaxID=1569284 RepID=UPI000582ACA9|nr:hypothetical protein [Bdellovibrio sp. ArHS]KHD88373.1 MAG: hypothetical protein OM95_09565 [Bdellovibrio sp. ArHS]